MIVQENTRYKYICRDIDVTSIKEKMAENWLQDGLDICKGWMH